MFRALLVLLATMVMATTNAQTLDERRLANARLLVEMDNTNYKDAAKFWTDDIIYEDAYFRTQGIDNANIFLDKLFDFMSEYKLEIYDFVYDSEKGIYMAYWRMYGSATLTAFGISSSEVPFDCPGMSILYFREQEDKAYFQKDLFSEAEVWVNGRFPVGTFVKFMRRWYLRIVSP